MADEARLVRELEQISQAIAAGDDLEETLERVLAAMRAATGAERCSIMLRSGGWLRIRASHGLTREVVETTAVPVGVGIAGGVAASGTARLLRDAASARGAEGSTTLYAAASALCVPLRAGGRTIGVVNLADKRGPDHDGPGFDEFDEDDLRVASLLANQAGLALGAAEAAVERSERERLQAGLSSLEQGVLSLESQASALAVIRQVTDSLVSPGPLDEILEGIVHHTTRLLGCRRGSLLLREPGSRLLRMQAAVGIPEKVVRRSRTELGRGLAGRCAETGEPILVADVDAIRPEVPGLAAHPDGEYRSKSAICVPLVLRGEVIGVLNLNDRTDGKELGRADLFVAQIVANQAAVALWHGQLREDAVAAAGTRKALEVAREIQQAFVPADALGHGVELLARSVACSGAGGDYVDFWPLRGPDGADGGEWVIAIGDASGHGVGAALVMATARAFLRGLLAGSRDLAAVLGRLNEQLDDDVRGGRFVTLFVGVLDPEAGTLRYASAGHDPPILRRAGGRSVELEATGPPLAVLREAEFPVRSVEVGRGDWLVLSTDGAWELRNEAGEAFGRERLVRAVDDLAAETPAGMLAGLRRRILGFAGATDPADDLSLAVVKVLAPGDAG
jgi:sigma-B regulation protein RsbU (phosphoserine phosphatase)